MWVFQLIKWGGALFTVVRYGRQIWAVLKGAAHAVLGIDNAWQTYRPFLQGTQRDATHLMSTLGPPSRQFAAEIAQHLATMTAMPNSHPALRLLRL
jgi:hypothetical protein